MPFIEEPGARPLLEGAAPPVEPEEKPGFLNETIPAALRTENLIGSTLFGSARGASDFQGGDLDSGFNPFDHIEGYEDQAFAFTTARSPEHIEFIKGGIDQERKDRETIASAGGAGFVAAMAAGVLDPTIFIPVGGQLKKGESLLRLTRNTMLAGGVSTGAQEIGLQAGQNLRTAEESALNIGGAVVLSGILGGAFGALTKVDKDVLVKGFERDMLHPGDGIDPTDPFKSARVKIKKGSLSAAEVDDASIVRASLNDNAIAGIETTAKATKTIDPLIRLMTSPSNGARSLAENLAESPLALNKNKARIEDVELPDGSVEKRVVMGEPKAQSVESAISRRTDRLMGETQKGIDDIYVKYLTGKDRKIGGRFTAGLRNVARSVPGLKDTPLALPEGKLGPRDFERQVFKALAREDAHEIAEVADAAKHIRETLFKPLEDDAVDLGMFGQERILPDDPDGEVIYVNRRPDVSDTAPSWRPRLYNTQKIVARRAEFVGRVNKHFLRERDKAGARVAELESELEFAINKDLDVFRADLRGTLALRNDIAKEAREQVRASQAAESKTGAVSREAATQTNKAVKRSKTLTKIDSLSDEEIVYYKGLIRDLERGHGAERPRTLIGFIRANGGLRDADFLINKDDLYSNRLTNNKTGKDIDHMRELAAEEGYIDEIADLNEFSDLVIEDINTRSVVHEDDLDIVAYDEFIENMSAEVSNAGIELNDLGAFASWHKGAKLEVRSKFNRGRVGEARLREEYALRRLKGAAEKSNDALDSVSEARVYARSMREHLPELTERANAVRKDIKGLIAKRKTVQKELNQQGLRFDATDAEILRNAEQTADRINASPAGRLAFDSAEANSGLPKGKRGNGASLSGRFKSRRLTIPDEEIEDFLEDELEMVLRSTARSMIPDIELTKKFGSVDLEPQIQALEKQFSDMAGEIDPKAPDAKKKLTALDRERKEAVRAVLGIRDRLRGTYALPEDPNSIGYRAIRVAKSVNYLRLMGGVTIASLPDVGRVMFANGFNNFTSVAFTALTGNISKLKIPAAELKFAGSAFEMVNDTRTMALADVFDDYGRHSKLERALTSTRNNFGQLSLMAPWNHVMKSTAGLTVQNRVLKAVGDLSRGKISGEDATYLARLGIGNDDAKAIAKKFKEFGLDDRVKSANTSQWDDPALADVFHNALRQEIDRVIVTPGQERPLFASGPLGSMLLQFNAYNFAASQRVAMAAAQGLAAGDAMALNTILGQITLGMMVAKIKMEQNGRSTADWNGRRWVAEGVDRSGILGALTIVNLLAERATAGRLGLSGLAGQGPLSRYHTRNSVGAFLGPSAGLVSDAFTSTSSLFQEDGIKEGDISAIRRMLPYQNLFYMNWLFNEAERLSGGRDRRKDQ